MLLHLTVLDCQNLTLYKNKQENVCICSFYGEKRTTEDTQELKFFEEYVDDRLCTVKGNPLEYLECANSLHKKVQITLETPNCMRTLALLELNINVNHDRKTAVVGFKKLLITA